MSRKLLFLTLFSFLMVNVQAISPREVPAFKIRDIERVLGRKLKLGEKLGVLIIRHKIKKGKYGDGTRDTGKTAFILGLIGLVGLIIPVINLASIPLAIMAIAIGNRTLKKDPGNRKASTAVTLGIITLAFLVVIGIIVAIVLTFGSIGPR